METGQDIYNQDGILLRKASTDHRDEFNTTGCLFIMVFPSGSDSDTAGKRYALEWRPTDGILISSTDTQEQDEWSFVDTIAKRNRTTSECLIFDTATNNISVRGAPNPQPVNGSSSGQTTAAAAATTGGESQAKPAAATTVKRNRNIRVYLNDLKQVDVQKQGQVVRLIKHDSKVHSEYLFQHGNADNLVRCLRSLRLLTRLSNLRTVYEVTSDETQEKMRKTFEELHIDDLKSPSTGWISNIVQRPMDMLAKIANTYNIHATPPMHHSPSESPTSSASPSRRATAMFQSTAGEDYELLSTSPRVTGQIAAAAGQLINNNNNNNRKNGDNNGQNNNHNERGENGQQTNGNGVTGAASSSSSSATACNNAESKPKLPERIIRPRSAPLSGEEWFKCFAEDGSASDAMVDAVKRRIFEGGVEPEIRVDVWKFLLDYEAWEQTTRQRELQLAQKNSEYYIMKSQWLRMSQVQEDNFSDYRDRKCQLQKDVKRTDRTHEFFAGDNNPNLETLYEILMTYIMYNFDLGYVQGMSDLLAPLLYVLRNERDAFWCFVGFMKKVVTNFDIDQAGMKNQLQNLRKLLAFVNPRLANHLKATDSDNMFFCFRWLLVWFKREFSQDDVMRLWEVLWTGKPCANYHLLVSVAVLDEQAEVIIGRNYEFTEVLKFVNELSGQMDLDRILENAEAIYHQVINAAHLTDEIRQILGMELEGGGEEGATGGEFSGGGGSNSGRGELNDEEDVLDQMKVASPVKSFDEEERRQKKIEEALEQSMYFVF